MDDVIDNVNLENVNPIIGNELLTSIVFALIILLIGFAVGKLIGVALFKFLNNLEFDKGLKKISNSKFHASKTISALASWLIYLVSIILALITLGVLNIALQIIFYFIAILVIGTILLGLVFALPNLIQGFKNKKKLKKGQKIEVDNIKGTITKTGLINTFIKGKEDKLFVVPNKKFKKLR